MKLWLVRPSTSLGRLVGAHSRQHPVGLCYLAAAARAGGVQARIIDCEVETFDRNRFAKALATERPDVVGLTAMTPVIERAARMARVVRKTLPGARTVVGGAHATALPRGTMEEFGCFDAVVAGEGEQKLLELCRQVNEGKWGEEAVAGCVFKREGEIVDYSRQPVAPLVPDDLPLPARDLLKLSLYRGGAPTPGIPRSRYNSTMLFTTRGCTGKCAFCAAHRMSGRHVRLRSVGSLVVEIRHCVEAFGFRHFTIDDDAFTIDRDRVMRFCREASKLNVTWDCDARVDQVDRELLAAMGASGCLKIAYGVESGSQRILDLLRKEITVEQIENAFRLTGEAGIMSCAFLMVGTHPDETAEDIRLTRELVRAVKPDLISVAITTPFPGTAIRTVFEKEGLLPQVPWSNYSQTFVSRPFTRTHAMTSREILRHQRLLLRSFYLSPSYVLRRIRNLRSLAEAIYWFSAGLQFILYLLPGSRRGGEEF